eukprot:1182459-Prorocentrum_minimum.AAC.4
MTSFHGSSYCADNSKGALNTPGLLVGYNSTIYLLKRYIQSQGATLNTRTILHIDGAFAPGLAYVMLSRGFLFADGENSQFSREAFV